MRILRSLVLLLWGLAGPAHAVSLMNGSVLTMDGLKLTVSGCTMILAGVTQSSCAAGNLVLNALSGTTGAAYEITGANGGAIFSAQSNAGLYDVAFTLAVAASVSGARTTVSKATLTMDGTAGSLCERSDVSVNQQFSAAAGSASLPLNLATQTTRTATFSPVSSFSISNTLKLDATGFFGGQTLTLTSVRETFNPAPEPAAAILLATGIGGLAVLRWRRARG